MIKKTNYYVPVNDLISLIYSLKGMWKNNQIAVTSRDGNDVHDGIGSISNYAATEREFSKLNQIFHGTCIEQIIKSINADGYSHGRIRLMQMNPKSVYSYHMDNEPRIHFAIITSTNAMFVIDKIVFQIPADGYGYWMDTTLPHTAFNADTTNTRVHLVIDLLIPVTKVNLFYNTEYKLLGKTLNQAEFDKWLIETKPHTEPCRTDFYFTE